MSVPRGLSPRARAFWRDMHVDGRDLSALEVTLLVEAARLITRSDRLDKELAVEWSGAVAVEARLTATALKAVVSELRMHSAGGRAVAGGAAAGPAGVDAAGEVGPGVGEGSPVDEIGRRRQARRADAAGGALPPVSE